MSQSNHYLRSFGFDLSAGLEGGEALGLVHATMVRPHYYRTGEQGQFDNGPFWGLIEFYDDLSSDQGLSLAEGALVVLRPGPAHPEGSPVSELRVQPVRLVRGEKSRWLVIEVTQ